MTLNLVAEAGIKGDPAPLGGPTTVPSLTEQEQLLLELIADGLTDSRIGKALGVAETSVRVRVLRLRLKVGAENRPNMVKVGYEAGLLPGKRRDGP